MSVSPHPDAAEQQLRAHLQRLRSRWTLLADATDLARWLENTDARVETERQLQRTLRALGALRFAQLAGEPLDTNLVVGWEATGTPVAAGALDVADAEADEPTESAPEASDEPQEEESDTAGAVEPPSRFKTITSPPRPVQHAPASPRVDLTPELVAKLKKNWDASRLDEAELAKDGDEMCGHSQIAEAVARALDTLGTRPTSMKKNTRVEREIERIGRVVREQLSGWADLPDEWDHVLCGYLTTRARFAQDAAIRRNLEREIAELNRLIPAISHHVGMTQSGFIHGLARGHEPKNDTWSDDAAVWEERLLEVTAVTEETDDACEDELLRALTEAVRDGLPGAEFAARADALLKAGVSPRETRFVNLATPYRNALDPVRHSALVKAIDQAEPAPLPEEQPSESLPDDWAGFALTEGKHAVIIGGDPRQERIPRIQDAFRFESLEWVRSESGGTRRLESLISRMENGNVDVVIALRAFSSHTITDRIFDARKRATECFVALADNYGETQIRLAIERFMGHRD